jgi:hypothetical protein
VSRVTLRESSGVPARLVMSWLDRWAAGVWWLRARWTCSGLPGMSAGRRTSYAQVTSGACHWAGARDGGSEHRRRCRRRAAAIDADVGGRRGSWAGDANATGQADLTINEGLNRSASPSAGRISTAPWSLPMSTGHPGRGRAVVVPLFSGAFSGTDSTSGCVQGVDRS